jgi:stage II sporulation protein D (peptidoglycan lytic transglycosylase)
MPPLPIVVRPAIAVLLLPLAAACGARETLPPVHVRPQPAPPVVQTITPSADIGPSAGPAAAVAATVATRPLLAAPPNVSILLTKPNDRGRARVRVKGRWTLAMLDGTTLAEGAALDAELVLAGQRGATLGAIGIPATGGELRPATESDLRIEESLYPGVLRVDPKPGGGVRIVVVTDVETYVAAVVNSEVPATYPRELQRTQAVLARTYTMAALNAASSVQDGGSVVLADSGGIDQEFHGIAVMPEHRRVAADAVESTRGLVVMDAGIPLTAYYHSSCGGTTCPGTVVFGKLGAQPALRGGVTCTGCATGNKYFHWNARLPGAKVVAAAGLTGQLERFAIAERTEGGRAATFDVTANGRTRRVRAPDFRLAVGASVLRSTFLEMAIVDGGELLVRGRGWGHGVGLCQMGARTMAEEGRSAESILAFYYPGAVLERRW